MKYQSRVESRRIVAQEEEYSCGAACARQLLLDVGIDVTEGTLRHDAELDLLVFRGILAPPLARALTKHHGSRYLGGYPVMDEEMHRLIERRAPVIVRLEHHWVIVDGIEGTRALVRDPAPSIPGSKYGTEAVMLLADLLAAWGAGQWQAVWRAG